ncbi:MAG: hypothetical protein ACYDBH_16705 [Acidobacteriaceae bacterium]
MEKESKIGNHSDGQLVELAGRNWLVSQLIQGKIEVARPERDRGVDLIAYIETPDFIACRIQVKVSSGPSFLVYREKYKGMLLAYVWNIDDSTKTMAYAMTSDEACKIAEAKGWSKTECWKKESGYYYVRNVGDGSRLYELLEPYRMTPDKWERKIRQVWNETRSKADTAESFLSTRYQ